MIFLCNNSYFSLSNLTFYSSSILPFSISKSRLLAFKLIEFSTNAASAFNDKASLVASTPAFYLSSLFMSSLISTILSTYSALKSFSASLTSSTEAKVMSLLSKVSMRSYTRLRASVFNFSLAETLSNDSLIYELSALVSNVFSILFTFLSCF